MTYLFYRREFGSTVYWTRAIYLRTQKPVSILRCLCITNKEWQGCDHSGVFPLLLLNDLTLATAKAARQLKCRHKLVLTGTPVQNRVGELWATMDFLMPNYLGSQSAFSSTFAKPIAEAQLHDASAEAIGGGFEKLKILHQMVLPFILRREKGAVLKELPPKIITDIPCPLVPYQESLYRRCCSSNDAVDALDWLHNCLIEGLSDAQPRSTDTQNHRSCLKVLLRLRLICTHPILVYGAGCSIDSSKVIDPRLQSIDCSGKLRVLNDILRSAGIGPNEITAADNDQSSLYISDAIGHDVGCNYNDDVAKSTIVDEYLDSTQSYSCCEKGDTKELPRKCLIFAQFNSSLDVVERYLFERLMPRVQYLRLDGCVPSAERNSIANQFNCDENIQVLLLTTRVGGLGLNLTGADTVIFLEHDWNPHVDIQAMDRAHRIGQEKVGDIVCVCVWYVVLR